MLVAISVRLNTKAIGNGARMMPNWLGWRSLGDSRFATMVRCHVDLDSKGRENSVMPFKDLLNPAMGKL